MYIVLSQRIDFESPYDDEIYRTYHFPAKYRKQIKEGDFFVYYQGDRRKREHRYYFGAGIVGKITTNDEINYYAELLEVKKFQKIVPIYLREKEYIEQLGHLCVRKRIIPPWQSSIRPISETAFQYILDNSKGQVVIIAENSDENTKCNYDKKIIELKQELKRNIEDFYIDNNNNAIHLITSNSKKLETIIELAKRSELKK